MLLAPGWVSLLSSPAPDAVLWPRCWLAMCFALMHDSPVACPRYSWSGEPLFLSCPTFEVSEVPACSGCGGQRTFEFQLMPALVSMLSSANLGKKAFTEFIYL